MLSKQIDVSTYLLLPTVNNKVGVVYNPHIIVKACHLKLATARTDVEKTFKCLKYRADDVIQKCFAESTILL